MVQNRLMRRLLLLWKPIIIVGWSQKFPKNIHMFLWKNSRDPAVKVIHAYLLDY